MQPAIILPIHDPRGIELPFLWQAESELKSLFSAAYVGFTAATRQQQPAAVERIQADPFYSLVFNPPGSLPGEHYRNACQLALDSSPPEQTLHLCNLDRVAFALLTGYREAFRADCLRAGHAARPVVFQRSPRAWETHPANYRQVESLLTQAGQLLFGRSYDFAWCHLAIPAGLLAQVLPRLQSRDFGILIELLLLLRPQLLTEDVDWLAWEDPFILARDPEQLRRERETSPNETTKRLRGILPFFEHFLRLEPSLRTELIWEKG